MKKTKHFNISVPELGDVPDITQVSNAISDLEDATAGTLEIMKAEMQGTKITLTSVSRKTKRTGYYEGMSIRFKSPQDIEPNYLKTISVDGLGDQTLSVAYKVNRNEYVDIVYEGNKFTAYPVVVQKTDSVSNNSSVLVGTAKGVKTAYDKGVEALNKANQAQSSANNAQSTADGKVSKSGDRIDGHIVMNMPSDGHSMIRLEGGQYGSGDIFCGGAQGNSVNFYNSRTGNRLSFRDDRKTHIDAENLNTQSKEIVSAINELNSGKENKIDKKSGFNLDKSDSATSNSSNTLATSLAVKTAYDKASQAQSTADGKVSKNGDTISGNLKIVEGDMVINANKVSTTDNQAHGIVLQKNDGERVGGVGAVIKNNEFRYVYVGTGEDPWNEDKEGLFLYGDGTVKLNCSSLKTDSKEVVGAINESYSFIKNNIGKKLNLTGGTMTGSVTFNDVNVSSIHKYYTTNRPDGWAYDSLRFVVNDQITHNIGIFGTKTYPSYIYFGKSYNDNMLRLYVDGSAIFYANNLQTEKKEVISAINELANNYKLSAVGTTLDFLAKKSILVPKSAKKMLISHNNNSHDTSFTSRIVYDGAVITSVKQLTVDSIAEVQIVYNGADSKFFYYSLEMVREESDDNGISVWYSY